MSLSEGKKVAEVSTRFGIDAIGAAVVIRAGIPRDAAGLDGGVGERTKVIEDAMGRTSLTAMLGCCKKGLRIEGRR